MKRIFHYKRLIFVLISVFILSACGKNKESQNYTSGGQKEYTKDISDELITEESVVTTKQELTTPPSPGDGTETTGKEIDIEDKIIKTATISCELKDYDKNKILIDSAVSKFSGIISQENEYRNEWNISNTIKIKVPSENFDKLVEEVLLISTKVDSKIITIEDVTEEYVDVYTRLQTKKEVELQYLEILKKANTINEILSVNSYLSTIREDIEAFEGKLKFLDSQVSMSTINLNIYENFNQPQIKEHTFWKKIGQALKSGWNGFLVFIIAIFQIWPLWLILGIIVFLIVRKIRKSKNNKQNLQS